MLILNGFAGKFQGKKAFYMLFVLWLLIFCSSSRCLAEFQRLGVPPQGKIIEVSSNGILLDGYCLDEDLEPPTLKHIPYYLISKDEKIVSVANRSEAITLTEAIDNYGLKIEASVFEIVLTAKTPLKIDLTKTALAFSETPGSLEDPNKVEDDVVKFLQNINPNDKKDYQDEIWGITRPVRLLRESDYWEGRKDYVSTKRKSEAEKRAREDLQIQANQNIYEILPNVSVEKGVPNRQQEVLKRKQEFRELNPARSSKLPPVDYLRDPNNNSSLVAYKKFGDSEIYVRMIDQPNQSQKGFRVTVFKNQYLSSVLDQTDGLTELAAQEADNLSRVASQHPGKYPVYGLNFGKEGVGILLGKVMIELTPQEFDSFRTGVIPEKLRIGLKNIKGVNGQKPQFFIYRNMLYQGRLGDLSKDGRSSPILADFFIDPNDLMTAFCRAFKNEADFWLTNDFEVAAKNTAVLPTIASGSQIGVFKGGVLDPRGDIASVESQLKKDYGVNFITMGKSKPADSDLVVFVAHNDGSDGKFVEILNKAIQGGLLENRIVVLGICGTGKETDFAQRILKEGKARAVLYFDKEISSDVLTDVLMTMVKVAKTEGNVGNIEALWRRTMERVPQSVKTNVEQFAILECPRFLAIRLDDGEIITFAAEQNLKRAEVKENER